MSRYKKGNNKTYIDIEQSSQSLIKTWTLTPLPGGAVSLKLSISNNISFPFSFLIANDPGISNLLRAATVVVAVVAVVVVEEEEEEDELDSAAC